MGQLVVAAQPRMEAALELPVEPLDEPIGLWAVRHSHLKFDAQHIADLCPHRGYKMWAFVRGDG